MFGTSSCEATSFHRSTVELNWRTINRFAALFEERNAKWSDPEPPILAAISRLIALTAFEQYCMELTRS